MSCIGWVQAGGAWVLRVPPFHVCPKSTCWSFVCRGLEAYLPFVFFVLLCELLFDFPFLSGAGPYLIMGLIFLWSTSWLPSFPAILFCYSCCNDSILLGLFRPAVYSFPQGLGMAIGFPSYGLLCPFGQPWPTCFLWASLALLLTLHSHGFLLISLGFPSPITLFSSLGFMGLPLTPYFLCLHYFGFMMTFSHFSTSYTAHGYVIFFFPGFFKPTCLFKAHLFISWPCDLLFLPLGPNDFAICLPILCCPCCWAFFFLLGLSQMTLNRDIEFS